ncbi:glutamine synthetase family protein [Streptomyces tubbatahanensis]|uniref:Glutamine synthetase family protein n=1 Tax=Streptomyces tubbatahanensis TaxID=2923272 RepID=A0ABY3XZX1_9ACTN|nr:glutamine synthetase family protein [Streptomyces tubbatahanensis]UNT00093.1 glutamine synthetase family protein [Streptomyces tubbatahanensis]
MGTTRRTSPQHAGTAAGTTAGPAAGTEDTEGSAEPGESPQEGGNAQEGGGAQVAGRAQEQAQAAAARLVRAGAHGIALTWVDNAGLTRVKAVPASRLGQALTAGVGMSPCFDVYLVDDSMTDSPHIGGPDGDLRLVPDPERLTVLAAQPGWAWAPAARYEQDGTPYAGCQRGFARRMAEQARDEHGIELRMGFETEWVVTRGPLPDAAGEPAYPTTGPAYGMARLVETSDYLREVLAALTAQGVEVLQIHPEYAPGQFEVSVAPSDPVGAADLAVLVRETVRAVSLRHGLTAMFGPVVDPAGVGSGGHLHLSLWREGRNLCAGGEGPFGMTRSCEAFLAGVFRELPALLALGAPTPASYLRLRPSRWAGAYQCWGLENREAALRFVAGTRRAPHCANAEVKCVDAAANPYLLVGGVLAAGLAGLAELTGDEGPRLPEPVRGDPAHTASRQAPPRLPGSLDEALRHFAASEVLRTALGEPLFGAVHAVREGEIALFEGASDQALAAATRGRY